MSRNRYVGDYRIVESIDGRGRVKSGYAYVGAPWAYAETAEVVRAARRNVTVCALVGWGAYVAALLPVSAATRTLFVSMPFILAAIPLAMIAALAWDLFRLKAPFEHRHADRLENRGPACSFFAILLSAIALAGEGINALRGVELLPGDAIFCGGAAALFACALVCHRQWKRLKCREIK